MQFFIFMTCLGCGIVSGVAYDVLYIVRCALCGVEVRAYTVKDKIFLVVCDLLYCAVFCAMFVFVSVMFGFDNLRLYMLLGCGLGALIYLKSFHVIVAFFVRKVYNRFINERSEKVERRKAQPHSRRGDR